MKKTAKDLQRSKFYRDEDMRSNRSMKKEKHRPKRSRYFNIEDEE